MYLCTLWKKCKDHSNMTASVLWEQSTVSWSAADILEYSQYKNIDKE